MTGYLKHNFPAFDRARDRLNRVGWDAVSPADIDRRMGINETSTPEETQAKMKEMIVADIMAILKCKAIYMLRGWERSNGSRVEHAIAAWLGIRIIYEGEKI